ncbi:MAG: hypothetical protein JKX81_13385 [Arenicella sp.]|nr:hypothetical protein [Arenicella sp.]
MIKATMLFLLFFLVMSKATLANDFQIGKRFYEKGLLADGTPVNVVLQGDIEADGYLINCASCHRSSGYGDGEGGNYVPPITGPVLFNDYAPERQYIFRNLYQDVQTPTTRAQVHGLKQRAAYTEQLLNRVITSGINSDGEQLSPQMPRFMLDKATLKGLTVYLKSLGAQNQDSLPKIGVEPDILHFATIFTPDVNLAEKAAIMAVFNAYFKRKNLNTIAAQKKPNYSSGYKSDFVYAQRQWQLHEWQLTGSAEQWTKQLAAFYQAQPVFSILGGKGQRWQAIHEFCEQRSLPCLFPNTPLPVTAKTGEYTLYFSKGLQGEANSLATYLESLADVSPVLQIYRANSVGEVAAEFLDKRLSKKQSPKVISSHLIVTEQQMLDAAFWKPVLVQKKTLVLWLNRDDFATLPSLNGNNLKQASIFVSASLIDLKNKPLSHQRYNKALSFIWPWALPNHEPKRLYRARAWMRSRGVPITHELEQLNTFFVLNVVDYAMHDLLDRFSRKYSIEIIERITENGLNPGLYRTMSLGPKQRFAVRKNSILNASLLMLKESNR